MAALTLLFSIAISTQLAPSADPRPIPISGVVVDPAGKPAADVTVWLIDGLPPGERRLFGRELSWMDPFSRQGGGLPPVCLETRTHADGKFTLDIPAEFAARRWPSPLALVAVRPGNGLVIKRLPVPLRSELTQVNVALAAPERTEIRVLDPAGKPVVGAVISPSEIDDVPIPTRRADSLAARPMARVRLFWLHCARLQEFLVDAPGFGKQRNRIEPEHVTEIRLAPVGRLAGRLVAPANEPIQGVSVRARTLVGGFEGTGQGGLAEVACDAAGRFEIPAIAAGKLTLEFVFDTAMGPRMRNEPLSRHSPSCGQNHGADNPAASSHQGLQAYSTSRRQAGQSAVSW